MHSWVRTNQRYRSTYKLYNFFFFFLLLYHQERQNLEDLDSDIADLILSRTGTVTREVCLSLFIFEFLKVEEYLNDITYKSIIYLLFLSHCPSCLIFKFV